MTYISYMISILVLAHMIVRCGVRRLLQSMVQEGLTGPEPTPDPRRRLAVDALAKEALPVLADRSAAAARLDGSLLAMRCAAAMSLRVGVFTWQARAGRAWPLGRLLFLASLMVQLRSPCSPWLP